MRACVSQMILVRWSKSSIFYKVTIFLILPHRQDNLQSGYIELARTLPWLHPKLGELDHEECEDMLRKVCIIILQRVHFECWLFYSLRKAQMQLGVMIHPVSKTSSLVGLIKSFARLPWSGLMINIRAGLWVTSVGSCFALQSGTGINHGEFQSFSKSSTGRWCRASVKAGIRDRTSEYIVSENSWPLFMYENYRANGDNLEEGFIKSKLLVLVSRNGFGDIIRSLWYCRLSKLSSRLLPLRRKLTVMATALTSLRIIGALGRNQISLRSKPVSPLSSTWRKWHLVPSLTLYVKWVANTYYFDMWNLAFDWQVRFALSGVSSWRTVDGDFDYEIFWTNIVTFFEVVPGPVTRRKMNALLEWWTRYFCRCSESHNWQLRLFRKVFGTNHRQDLTPKVMSQMSVNTLAEQRRMLEDAVFDSE